MELSVLNRKKVKAMHVDKNVPVFCPAIITASSNQSHFIGINQLLTRGLRRDDELNQSEIFRALIN